MKFWTYFIIAIALASCAVESSPTGGDQDTTPPEITESTPPNFSTNFEGNTIEISFNEYVELKNFTQQFSISPPLESKPRHLLKGKTLYIELFDTLAPNTTYTLNFGNSIIDITEGNPQTDFKYVFSTGDQLDSLHIHGVALNAKNNKPVAGAIAMLYPEHKDSTAYKNKPLYYAVTKEDGSFGIENIKDQPYHIVVVDDQDFNFQISGDKELIGFETGMLDPKKDTTYTIGMFYEEPDFFLEQAKLIDFGKVNLYYSKNVSSSFKVWDDQKSKFYIDFREGRDTLTILFNPEKEQDTILFYAQNENQIDTIWLRNSDFNSPSLALSASPITVTPNIKPTIACNVPILGFDNSQAIFVENDDTVKTPGLKLLNDAYTIELDFTPEFGSKYQMYFYPGFVNAMYDLSLEDTVGINYNTKKETDYAYHILNFLPSDASINFIIQLINSEGKVVFEKENKGKLNLNSPNLEPDSYTLKVIVDANNNGKWDTGNYIEGIQPENVLYYPDAISLRANWEIETTWKIQ